MTSSHSTKKRPKPDSIGAIYARYPGPTLAIAMLISLIFSFGVAWATASSRIQRLEDTSEKLATKEELATIREMIKGVNEKIDILLKRS